MQLVLAAAGAVVGGFIGGPTGAAIGWSLGAGVGGVLFAPRTHSQGPRLQDLTLSGSAYGVALPEVHGMAPCGGNIIWAGPKVEHENRHKVGKGGGSTYSEFTYTRSFVLAICKGPIAGVRRVWANEKLIYDISASATPPTIAGTQQVADNIRIYLGAADQMPSALIESFEGVGNVPGYRGVALCELTDFEEAPYGNVEPNFKFEVVANGSLTSPTLIRTYTSFTSTTGTATGTISAPNAARIDGGSINVQQIDLTHSARAVVSSVGDEVTVNAYPVGYILPSPYQGGVASHQVRNDPSLLAVMATQYDQFNVPIAGTEDAFFFAPQVESASTAFTGARTWQYVPGPWVALTLADGIRYLFQSPTQNDRAGAARVDILARVGARALVAGRAVEATEVSTTPVPSGLVWDGTGTVGLFLNYIAADEENRWIIGGVEYATTPRTLVIDAETMQVRSVFQHLNPIAASAGRVISATFVPAGPHWVVHVYDVSAAGGTVAGPLTAPEVGTSAPLLATSDPQDAAVPGPGLVLIGSELWRYTDILTPAAWTLQDTVEAIATAAGYAPAEVNAADLASITVAGYVRRERMSGAAQLGALTAAYSFDAAEIDGVLVARRRTATVDAAIAADDLLYDEGQPSVASTRAQESELPRQLDLSYMSAEADYAVGTQSAQRIVTASAQQVSLDVPVVMPNATAGAMAQRLLWEAWIGRTSRAFALGPKWSKLAPMDVVTLPLPDGLGTATVRLTSVKRDGIKLVCEAVDVDAAAFTQPGIGGAITGPGNTLLVAQSSVIAPVDLPSLRDVDDTMGIYAGVSALPGTWPGAAVFIEPSTGADPMQIGTAAARAAMGFAATALPNTALGDGNLDLASSVDVDLLYGDLPSSITTAQLLNSSANAFLIGSEVICARTVTVLGGRRVRLSEMVRGLRGTVGARSTHVAGERVVQLDANLIDLPLEQSWIGNEATLVAVTRGKLYSTGMRVDKTLTGGRLRPLPPANLRAVRTANSDMVLMWTRRARLNSTWQGYRDVPLDETSELYKVEICNSGGTVLRTFEGLAATSQTYTAAQQAADFGTLEFSTVRVRVTQFSDRVGYGTPADQTLTILGVSPLILLMHFNGTVGSQVFTDSSPYARTITTVGNQIAHSSTQSKFGGISGFFNTTSSSNYLLVPWSSMWAIGTNDFTIDFWGYRTANGFEQSVISNALANRAGLGNAKNWLVETQGGDGSKARFRYGPSSSNWHYFANATPLNQQNHFAITRLGGRLMGFLNGAMQFSASVSYDLGNTNDPMFLGTYADGVASIAQYIDELRVVNGICYWATDFTPPAAPYS